MMTVLRVIDKQTLQLLWCIFTIKQSVMICDSDSGQSGHHLIWRAQGAENLCRLQSRGDVGRLYTSAHQQRPAS